MELAISQALILTGTVQYVIRRVIESMQQITSVQRILQYTDLSDLSHIFEDSSEIWANKWKMYFLRISSKQFLREKNYFWNLRPKIHEKSLRDQCLRVKSGICKVVPSRYSRLQNIWLNAEILWVFSMTSLLTRHPRLNSRALSFPALHRHASFQVIRIASSNSEFYRLEHHKDKFESNVQILCCSDPVSK